MTRAPTAPTMTRAGRWLVAFLVLTAIALLLAACTPKTAPAVFAEALPPIVEPEHVELPALDEPWPQCFPTMFLPGRAPPLTADGKATCRGMVVPDADVVELHLCRSDLPYWREVAFGERTERLLDWARCEAVAAQRWDYGEELRRDLVAQRWASLGLGVGGVILGVMLGFAAGSLP